MNSQDLIHTLHQISRHLTNQFNETLKKHGLYSAQWAVIYVLKKKGSMTQRELCQYLSVEAPPLTRTIQRLVKQGFVKQVQGKDKREKYIQLTEAALREYPVWEEAANAMDQSLLQHLQEESQAELLHLLKMWLGNLPNRKEQFNYDKGKTLD